MEWRDTGLILSARPHGETARILDVLTTEHGRHLGVVRGGASRKQSPVLQPGNQISLTWRARLPEHLGSFVVEPLQIRSARLMSDPLRLSALASLCATCSFVLPERETIGDFQAETTELADRLVTGDGWLSTYLIWELELLRVVGFGLDLSRCVVSGAKEELRYVSPKSGRAVSATAAGDWASRLLPLPQCLLGGAADLQGAIQALDLTGYFLTKKVAPHLGGQKFPSARKRFMDQLARSVQHG